MKLSTSFLLLSTTFVTSQAQSSLRRGLIDATSVPTASVTTYLPTYSGNATDDDGNELLMPEVQTQVVATNQDIAAETTSTEPSPKDPTGGPEKPDKEEDAMMMEQELSMMFNENEVMDEDEPFMPSPKPEHEKPHLNDTMIHEEMFESETNETLVDDDDEGLPGDKHEHGKPHLNDTVSGEETPMSEDKLKPSPMHEKVPGPKGFQELVDDKCASFECPMLSNSTCPTPPEPLDKNSTEGKIVPFELTDGNETEAEGPKGTKNGPGPKGKDEPMPSSERELKPHHKPEELLACACCEGVTVEEIEETGVDVSGLAFLVGYDPSAVTSYDNGSSLNSIAVSGIAMTASTVVLSLFL